MAVKRHLAERQRICPNCREPLTDGGHFVPPSLGERGFFICQELKALEAKPMSDEGRARLERYTQDVSCLYRDDEGEWVRYEDAQQAIAAARAEGEAAGRAAEREACAKVADLHVDGAHPDDCIGCRTARGIAAAIRTRGEADQ
jgi:hypothetical protein